MKVSCVVFLYTLFVALCMPLKVNCANISKLNAEKGVTALMAAARDGDSKTIQTLLDNGADIHAQDNFSMTPLMAAALMWQSQAIQALMDNKADIHAQDKDGATALMIAAVMGHSQAIQILLDNGAHIHARDEEDGVTALMLAAMIGHSHAVKTLLENKANPRVKTNDGVTALDFARSQNYTDIVKLLEQYGAK